MSTQTLMAPLAFLSGDISAVDPDVAAAIAAEAQRQNDHLELIASENFVSRAVRQAAGSILTNKYAEGYPGKRYYGGCEFVDRVESLAIERAKTLFSASHANVQPHSGSQANMAVYLTVLQPGDTILGMNLSHGGHLTHGHPLSFSGREYKVVSYGVRHEDELMDYDDLAVKAREHRPKLIIAGASAYSRTLDFDRFADIAEEVGALLMCDISHIAGPVAVGLHPSPVKRAAFVTTTTHKTLRGPRGGMILCQEKFQKELDRNVFPGVQGGPLEHIIAAKAVCLHEAARPEFAAYQRQVLDNARTLADALAARGYRVVSGGTDTHLFSVDVGTRGITGRDAENALDAAGITVNKNTIPFDPLPPLKASGIRVGTPAVTTRGMGPREMDRIADLMAEVLAAPADPEIGKRVRRDVAQLCRAFPLDAAE